MKTENPIKTKGRPARLATPSIAPHDQPVNDLSPEAIVAKSRATTQLLVEILERHSMGRQVRHWGINE